MKKLIVAISLTTIFSVAALAQGSGLNTNAGAGNNTSASKQGKQIDIASDTQVSARLEKTLDVKRAKPGDQVVMKTLQPIKQDGQTIVPRGTRLVGHVTDVAQRTKSNGQSRLGVALDRLERGSQTIPVTGTITSIVQASSRTMASNEDLFGDTMMSTSTRSSTTSSASAGRSGGGGLLGGVGNTVGGVTNSVGSVAGNTTSAVGSTVGSTVNTTTGVVDGTTGTVRNTTGSTLNTVRGLQVSPSAGASGQGGSTLSLNGDNLRVDSGATLNLLISGSANSGRNQ